MASKRFMSVSNKHRQSNREGTKSTLSSMSIELKCLTCRLKQYKQTFGQKQRTAMKRTVEYMYKQLQLINIIRLI